MRFYLVDRICSVDVGKRLTAVKQVSAADPVLVSDPKEGPSLAHTLAIEGLAQASAWLVMATTDFAQRGILGGFRHIRMGRPAPLGCRLDLLTEVEDWSAEGVLFSWTASCGGELVVQVEGALCLLVDAGTLEDPEATRSHYQFLLREGAEVAPSSLAAGRPPARTWAPSPLSAWQPYDFVQECRPGERAAARRAIAMTDPVFETHFPRAPVVPGVLLLESLLAVGRLLVEEGGTRPARVSSLRGVRYRRYVRPGDALELKVEQVAESRLRGQAEVEGEAVVAVREIAFGDPER